MRRKVGSQRVKMNTTNQNRITTSHKRATMSEKMSYNEAE